MVKQREMSLKMFQSACGRILRYSGTKKDFLKNENFRARGAPF